MCKECEPVLICFLFHETINAPNTLPNDVHENDMCDFELCVGKYYEKCAFGSVYCSVIFTQRATRKDGCAMFRCLHVFGASFVIALRAKIPAP